MSVISTGRACWKSVPISSEKAASDKEFQFLSGFEEITSYDLSKLTKKSKKKTKAAATDINKNSQNKRESKIKKPKKPYSPKPEENLDAGKQNSKRKISSTDEQGSTKKKRKDTANSTLKTLKGPPNVCNPKKPQGDIEIQNINVSDEVFVEPEEQSSSLLPGWENLFVPIEVEKALKDLGFVEPTPIQKLVLPSAIRDRLDILGAAETGSGKTLAFGIPIVNGLLEEAKSESSERKGLKALILTPTRELAIQIKDHIAAILRYTKIKVSCLVGGLSIEKQQRLLKKRPEILVGTPGRLWAFMEQASENDYLATVSDLRFLVIDETDRMVEKGHFEELTSILDHFKLDEESELSGKLRQTFVFSATLTYVHPPPKRLTSTQAQQMSPKEKIDAIVALTGLRKQRKIIDITRSAGTAESLTETRINCSNLEEKDASLYYFLLQYPGRTLVFTNSIDASRRLHGLLSKLKVAPFVLNAKMHQKQRFKNLERFVAGDQSVLLATDVAARGLDIRGIEHVVHYQVPKTAEIYVHRSGRTARASRSGLSVILVDPNDAPFYRRICRNLNREKDLPVFPMRNDSLLRSVKERVRVATQLESLEHRIRRINSRENWFVKNAREADLDLDHLELGKNVMHSVEELSEMKRQVKQLEKEIKFLLSEPLRSDGGPSTRYLTFDMVTETEKERMDAVGVAMEEKNARVGDKTNTIGGRLKLKERKKKGDRTQRKKKTKGKSKKRSRK